jgi:putative peptidoglycan lipid II flippase
MIVFVLAFGGKANINSIAYGYVAGATAGLILQYIKLKRINAKLTINFKHYKDFSSTFIKLLTPVLVSTSIGQINMFVDRIFASYLTDGSMSYLAYADKVSSLPVMIFSGMVATVVFPELIEHINNKEEALVKNYIRKSIIATMIFLIPSFIGIIVLNKEIIKLLFERNAFDMTATANTASALFYYSPTIIMYGGMAVIAKVYYSMKDTKTLMYISTVTILLNVIFDYVLMKPLAHNGLALSTSLVSVIQFITAYFVLKKKINMENDEHFQKSLCKICISSIIMGIFIYGLKTFIGPYIKSNLVIVAASIIGGAFVYFMFLIILKVDEVKEIINKLKPHSIKGEA